jgi:pimeloyl-ACP methyl ester carboxylesterase
VPAAVAGPSLRGLPALAACAAGIVLLATAFRMAFRGCRRRTCIVGLPIVIALLQWGVLPAVGAGLIASAPHPAVSPARSLGIAGARDVTFPASDGVALRGWYVPGRSGAAVIVMHGSHGTRADATAHLRMLHRAGFAVLAFDARGHGQSAGETNALGWRGAPDVAGAVRFLRSRAGIEPGRIGALGLSMGAEEALRAAADGVPLAAVVADGAGASTSGDATLAGGERGMLGAVARSVRWLTMREAELVSGDGEPAPLADLVARIHVPVLLIASSATGERATDAAYARLIGPRAHLWYVPDAAHTRALGRHPAAYAAHVLAVFAALR